MLSKFVSVTPSRNGVFWYFSEIEMRNISWNVVSCRPKEQREAPLIHSCMQYDSTANLFTLEHIGCH